eukprot:scaffold917_cov188-Prasinococcus_capsulatus_cf.AAC.1
MPARRAPRTPTAARPARGAPTCVPGRVLPSPAPYPPGGLRASPTLLLARPSSVGLPVVVWQTMPPTSGGGGGGWGLLPPSVRCGVGVFGF